MKKNNEKKKSPRFGNLIVILMYLAVGGVCGFLITDTMNALPLGEDPFLKLFVFATSLFLLVWVHYLSILLHEGGHLVAGLLTGYGFSSFRIGSQMLVKEKGRLRFRRLSLFGTGGQCLLTPPPLVDGKCPYILYNLGGSLSNLFFAALFFGLSFHCYTLPLLRMLLLMAALIGFAFALTNGIPLRTDAVNNDGKNTLEMRKNPRALYAFWLQMAINEKTAEGVRLRDMPQEWFLLPERGEWDDGLLSSVAVFCENRLMDEHRFPEAKALSEALLAKGDGVPGVYRFLLSADLLYLCALSGDREGATALYDKKQKSFMKQMASFPSVIRTDLALALLFGDEEKKRRAEARFERVKRTHPYTADIESEEELIGLLYEAMGKESGLS